MASTTPPTTTSRLPPTVTPVAEDPLSKRMSVEKGVVDELLLVCGVIGSVDADTNEFIPVTDCLNWLQDMQRALRRDDDTYRPISLLIGNWKVVQQKLLPLVLTCRYDNPLVLTVVKILVILTKPLSDTTKRAGRMVIDTKSGKVPESVIKEQIKLRENALQQSDMLMDYKRAITHHSSHIKGGGLLSIFVSLLAEPLSKTGTARTDADHLTIELVLHLFRNLLSAEPILKGSTETSHKSAQLHHELINLFERELVLEILYVIAQDMESRENAQYNLLMMELLNHMLRSQDPTAVARSTLPKKPAPPAEKDKTKAAKPEKAKPKPGSLLAELQREKLKLRPTTSSRHSHFGGTLVVNRQDGKRQYMSASLGRTKQPTVARRKNRKTDPFIGSGRTSSYAAESPAALRAQCTLHTFCERFTKDCYGPLMKSLKNEFRRDSSRLEEGDKVVFFRIVWFFCQWWRVADRKSHQEDSSALGQLIFTMDVFTFNLVLNATDTFQQHKKYTQLAQAVALYSEMMQLLFVMYSSKDSTEAVMALGLLDRLFYGSEPLDRLPKLLSKWTPGTLTREYLCDLVELGHVSLKLLEANAKSVEKQPQEKNDAVTRMKQTAADFDMTSYVVRKIVSNQVVHMYTSLLSQYVVNPPHVNHHILALFLRMSRLHVATSEDTDDNNPLNEKTVTLEPMLYNIQLIMVLEKILNDQTIRKDKQYASLISFASGIMSRFAANAQVNPMLYVESLFRHQYPHRYCILATNMYVNEELRMIAERERLLEEHRRLASLEDGSDEEDEGLERDRSLPTRSSARGSLHSATNRAILADDDDEEVEWNDGEKNEISDAAKAESPVTRSSDKNRMGADTDDDDTGNEQQRDKRVFAPKSKLLEDESDDATTATTSVEKKSSKLKRKFQNHGGDESSDDEGMFGIDASTGKAELPGAADGDDSDGHDDMESCNEKRAFGPKRKFAGDVNDVVAIASPEKKQKTQDEGSEDSSNDEINARSPAAFEATEKEGTMTTVTKTGNFPHEKQVDEERESDEDVEKEQEAKMRHGDESSGVEGTFGPKATPDDSGSSHDKERKVIIEDKSDM